MTKIHELTYPQFYDAFVKERTKNYNCTIKEAEYGAGSLTKRMHFEACFIAAKFGVVLKRSVLDSLGEAGRYRIFHDLPDYLDLYLESTGEAYIEPGVRKESKQKFYDFRRLRF